MSITREDLPDNESPYEHTQDHTGLSESSNATEFKLLGMGEVRTPHDFEENLDEDDEFDSGLGGGSYSGLAAFGMRFNNAVDQLRIDMAIGDHAFMDPDDLEEDAGLNFGDERDPIFRKIKNAWDIAGVDAFMGNIDTFDGDIDDW